MITGSPYLYLALVPLKDSAAIESLVQNRHTAPVTDLGDQLSYQLTVQPNDNSNK